jgi:predicted regulator of Ras-like GTPase activity (Roadblock/LC7/MglB family)
MSDNIKSVLINLNSSMPEIFGGAVISIEGLIISSVIQRKFDEDLIGGMTAAMLGIGERISAELMGSEMKQIYVHSLDGYVVVNAVGDEASLVVLVSKQAKLGLVFLEIQRAIRELEEIFETVASA